MKPLVSDPLWVLIEPLLPKHRATLAFLGERPNELPQVYTLDTRRRVLTQRTHATTVIAAFDLPPAGEPLLYAAEETPDTTGYAAMRAHGFVLDPRAFVGDAIAGDWLALPLWEAQKPRAVWVVRRGEARRLPLPVLADGPYTECDARSLSVAPSGDVALLQCTPRAAPAVWGDYHLEEIRWLLEQGRTPAQYVVVDLATGHTRPLVEAPVPWATTIVWAPDGRSVVMANALLPLTGAEPATRAARARAATVVEVDVHTGAVVLVTPRDSLIALGWDAATGVVELAPGEYEPAKAGTTTHLYYRREAEGWTSVPARLAPAVPALVVDQGLNTPARLVALDPTTQARHVVYDPNPGLLTTHRFGREDVVHWTTKAGAVWVGGLYWPPDYVVGRRYPLVIQTHGFDSTAFWPVGFAPTGEAAQPLANAGVMVLQVPRPPGDVFTSPPAEEAPAFVDGMEGAIDYLDRQGLIDRTRIGMQGWSRTCYYTLYFLTHSSYPLAAATVTDGVDLSYLQSMLWYSDVTALEAAEREAEERNGGPPIGPALATWLVRAPGFNLDRITAPLRLTALGSGSLLREWEPYAGLLMQHKPVELLYLPDGAHVLKKPWELLASQQGAVDWYRFWLQGVEDADPAKAAQYVRWRELRQLQQQQTAGGGAVKRGSD